MWVDYHSHILPGIDDGAPRADVSVEMIARLQRQGVERIVLTPHYYAAKESIASFLDRRAQAYQILMARPEAASFPPMRLGAEVRLERNTSSWENLRELCIEGTEYILIELPYLRYDKWMLQEVENLTYAHRVMPILAHLDRYVLAGLMTQEEARRVCEFPEGTVQLNASISSSLRGKRLLHRLVRGGYPVVFGSDAHNLTDRAPHFDRLIEMLGKRYEPPVLL